MTAFSILQMHATEAPCSVIDSCKVAFCRDWQLAAQAMGCC